MQDFGVPVTETHWVFVREKQSPSGEICVGTIVTGVFLLLSCGTHTLLAELTCSESYRRTEPSFCSKVFAALYFAWSFVYQGTGNAWRSHNFVSASLELCWRTILLRWTLILIPVSLQTYVKNTKYFTPCTGTKSTVSSWASLPAEAQGRRFHGWEQVCRQGSRLKFAAFGNW